MRGLLEIALRQRSSRTADTATRDVVLQRIYDGCR